MRPKVWIYKGEALGSRAEREAAAAAARLGQRGAAGRPRRPRDGEVAEEAAASATVVEANEVAGEVAAVESQEG